MRVLQKYITQPPNSNLCGQTCVAMLAGITLEESIEVFGTSGPTRTKDLIRALTKLGFKTDKKLGLAPRKHIKGWCSKVVSIQKMVVQEKPRRTHWVLSIYGLIVDPSPYPVNGRIISGLAVRFRNGVRL